MEEAPKKNNMLEGFHIKNQDKNGLVLNTNKLYTWFIPKVLRDLEISKGDIVWVRRGRYKNRKKKGNIPVLVMNVYRQELEEHEKIHKPVVGLKERAPKRSKAKKATIS